MVTCPKCQIGTMDGPVYGKGDYGQEWLRYRCAQCGYSYKTATKEESDTIAARAKFFEAERLAGARRKQQ